MKKNCLVYSHPLPRIFLELLSSILRISAARGLSLSGKSSAGGLRNEGPHVPEARKLARSIVGAPGSQGHGSPQCYLCTYLWPSSRNHSSKCRINTSIYFALTNKSSIERQKQSFESPMLAKI